MREFYNRHKKAVRDAIIFCGFLLIPMAVYFSFARSNMIWGGPDSFQWLSFTKNWSDIGFSSWQKTYSGGSPSTAFYVLNPLELILCWLPENYFVYAVYCLHIAIGAFFLYKFLNEIECSTSVSLAIALIYEFSVHISGIRRGHMVIITVITFLPAVMFFIQKYFNTKALGWMIVSAIPLSFAIYGGHIQNAIYMDIMVFFYIVALAFKYRIGIKKLLCHGFSWGFTYIALCAPVLIPRLALMKEYISSAASDSSPEFEFFQSYSIHPIKLLEFFFPNLFGNMSPQAFGASNSSEVDFEIFIGFVLGVLAIYGIIKYWKDFYIRLSAVFAAAAFLYCACPHIPVLKDIIFNTPVLGGFRCASRALFIFIFFIYVIAAITLTKLTKENITEKILRYMSRVFSVLVVLIVIISIACAAIMVMSPDTGTFDKATSYLWTSFFGAIIASAVICAVAALLRYLKNRNKINEKTLQRIFIAVIAGVTLAEVYPYSFYKHNSLLDTSESITAVLDAVEENVGNKKIWEAFPAIDGGHTSAFTDRSVSGRGLQVINSYMSLNDPGLYRYISQNSDDYSYNFSGMMTGTPNAASIMLIQNDFLSMMGVKYILDNRSQTPENGMSITYSDAREIVLNEELVEVPAFEGDIVVLSYPISLEDDTMYKLEFDSGVTLSSGFTVDLYGGEQYDYAEQERGLETLTEDMHYEFIIFSGNASEADWDTELRILSWNPDNIRLRDLRLSKLDTTVTEGVYTVFYDDGENLIYENNNAKDILYIPLKAAAVENEDEIFNNMFTLDLANVSYMSDCQSFDTAPAEITETDFGNDYIKAQVSAQGKTFVNFSQNYNSGWRAYVDGAAVPVHKVNGLIMGIEVPEGSHSIEFRYVSVPTILGYAVALAAVLIWVVFFVVKCVRGKKPRSENAVKEK